MWKHIFGWQIGKCSSGSNTVYTKNTHGSDVNGSQKVLGEASLRWVNTNREKICQLRTGEAFHCIWFCQIPSKIFSSQPARHVRKICCHSWCRRRTYTLDCLTREPGLLGITSYSRQDPEMAWRSFFAVQQQLFFWAINKTEVQKIDIKIEVEVSSWLWLD